MQFKSNTRCELIKYALKNMDLRFDFKKNNDKTFDYIIMTEILVRSFYCIESQLDTCDELHNNGINKLINYVVNSMKIDDEYYNDVLDSIIGKLNYYDIGIDCNLDSIVLPRLKDIELLKYIELFLEFTKTKRNKKSRNKNNHVAEDGFLFEKTIKQAAIDLYKNKNVSQKLRGIQGAGQGLIADTVINNNNKYILIDTKFFGSNILNKEYDKETYKCQINTFQINAYIDQLKCNKGISSEEVVGLIIHAVDKNMYNRYINLNGSMLDIGHNKIRLELVRIDMSAEEIIQQIKDIMIKYS